MWASGDCVIRFEAFERLGPRVAACSDSADGDLGFGAGTAPATVAGDRARLCGTCGCDSEQLVCARQTHGDRVIVVSAPGRPTRAHPEPPEADGLLTRRGGPALGVTVADCVPIFLYDPVKDAGGLVHAGRAGTLARIGARAIQQMITSFGSSPQDIHALLGPSAGPCCYEVSLDIAKAFIDNGLDAKGRYVDLWASNQQILVRAGLFRENIALARICTICDGRFHSYRATATPRRNLALFEI